MSLARVAVHFQYVVEKFTPSDTTFAFTVSTQLKDSALSKACSLHTASASIKSSCDSLRQRGLAEIAEDAQENQPGLGDCIGIKAGSVYSVPSDLARTLTPKERVGEERTHSVMRSPSPSPSLRTIRHRDKALPSTPPETGLERKDMRLGIDDVQPDRGPGLEVHSSFQSARPATRDLYSAYEYKPKIKLGPRPSIDSVKRPNKSDSFRYGDPRPISTLPPSIRLPGRKPPPTASRTHHSPKPSHEKALPKFPLSTPLPIIPMQTLETSSQVGLNGVTVPARGAETKAQNMTPEKRRLMKALQLRQKQLAARTPTQPIESKLPSTELVLPRDNNIQETNEASNRKDEKSSGPIVKRHEEEDSDVVHIVIRDIDEFSSAVTGSSPISILEPSDGPSTTASSMTEEQDIQLGKDSESVLELDPLLIEATSLSPGNKDFRPPPTEVSVEDLGPPSTQDHLVRILDVASPSGEIISPSEVPLPETSDDEFVSLNNYNSFSEEENVSPRTLKPVEENSDLASNHVIKSSPEEQCTSHEIPKAAEDSSNLACNSLSEEESAIPNTLRAFEESNNSELASNYEVESASPELEPTEETSPGQPHKRSSEAESATFDTSKPIGQHSSLTIPTAQENDGEFNITRPSTGDTMNEHGIDRVSRQHSVPRSIRRISSHENSDDHFLSDDSFMEELRSATVQEAKPISVSKSPINPLLPKQPNGQGWGEFARKSRSVSSPTDDGIRDQLRPLSPRTPLLSTFRSVSASQPASYEPQQASTIMLKKVGVSTGISQRIKALEKLSSRPTSPSSQPHPNVASPGAPPASLIFRKASLQKPQGRSEIAKNGNTYPPRMSSLSPSPSPEAASLNMKGKSVNIKATSKSKRPRPESISVTATIVRDPRKLVPAVHMDPSEAHGIGLYESPLVVEHQSAELPTQSSPLKPPRHKFGTSRSASSSSTERESETHQTNRRDSFASRRSTQSRRGSEADIPRSHSDTSSNGMPGLDGIKVDKKESRKSRLFKRMSTISSASRRSIVYAFNSPVKEQPIAEHHEAVPQADPVKADFGDVNIQFPDNLVGSLGLIVEMTANARSSSGSDAT